MRRTARVHVRKNDQVYVIAGKDRGKTGRVMQVYPASRQVLVEGVNMVKKAMKADPSKNAQGGVVQREAPLHVSNVSVICPETNAPSRVGRKVLEDGSRVRIARRSGALLDKS